MPGKERPQKGNDTYCGMCRERIAPSRGIRIEGTVVCRGCAHVWLARQQHLEDIRGM